MFDSPVRFRYFDGQIVEFPSWPQCRARVARGNRRCRNEVVDTGQTGSYLELAGGPAGWEVDRADDEEKLRSQLCRVHVSGESTVVLCEHEGTIVNHEGSR